MNLNRYDVEQNAVPSYNELVYANPRGRDTDLNILNELEENKEQINTFNPQYGEYEENTEPVTDFKKENAVSILDISEIDLTKDSIFSDNLCKKFSELAILDRAIQIMVTDRIGNIGREFSESTKRKIFDKYGINIDREELKEGGYIKIGDNPFQTGFEKYFDMARQSEGVTPIRALVRSWDVIKNIGKVIIDGPADYKFDEEERQRVIDQQRAVFDMPEDEGSFRLYKIVNIQNLWVRKLNILTQQIVRDLEKSEERPNDPLYHHHFNMDESADSDTKLESTGFLVVRDALFPKYYIIFAPLVPHISEYLKKTAREWEGQHACNIINNYSFKTKIHSNIDNNTKEEVIVDSNLWLDQVKRYMPEAYKSINADLIDWWNSNKLLPSDHTVKNILDLENYNCKRNYDFCKTNINKKNTYFYNSCIPESKMDCCRAKRSIKECVGLADDTMVESHFTKRIRNIFANKLHKVLPSSIEKKYGKPDIVFVGTSLGGGSGQLGILWLIDQLNKDKVSIYNIDGVFFNAIRSCNINAFQIMKKYNNIMPVHFINSRLDFYKKNKDFYVPFLFIDPLSIAQFNPEYSDIPTRYILLDNNINQKYSGWQLNSNHTGLLPLPYDDQLILDNCKIYKMKDNTLNKYNIHKEPFRCVFDMLIFGVLWNGWNILKKPTAAFHYLINRIIRYQFFLLKHAHFRLGVTQADIDQLSYNLKTILGNSPTEKKFNYYFKDSGSLHATICYYSIINNIKKIKCKDADIIDY
jgi:hypothetical protein